jgi:hypothetical protein
MNLKDAKKAISGANDFLKNASKGMFKMIGVSDDDEEDEYDEKGRKKSKVNKFFKTVDRKNYEIDKVLDE